ncbi:MAG: hypothetical protein QNJ11_06970 [Woeseiaceae bacterium]|nr:hypothetical protein [Woeseiaceae bacterium]
MKTSSKTIGLSIRLGALAAALLMGQQAMAEGTRAGTVVENTASVDYFVGGVDQTDITSNTVSFVVDRRVNLTMVPTSTPNLDPVSPGQNDVFADFLLTNTSNSDLDIDLVLANAASTTTIDGTADDDSDLDDPRIALWTAFESGTPAAPAAPATGTTTATVDNIPADDAIRIRVWGNVGLALVNGAIAGLEVTATALADDGTALAYGVANTDGLENVDVNGNDGIVVSNDGFEVNAASLSAAKSYTVEDDPLSSGLAIPGARLRYEIEVTNAAGSATATNIVITDAIDTDVQFLDNAGGSTYTDIEVFDGTTTTQCTATDGDSDGCQVVGGVLTVGDPVERVIDIAAGGSYRVRFEVLIPNPATTP